jgi:DNA-binding Xre family transcriptional regulator
MGSLKLRKYRVLERMEKAGYATRGEFADALGVSRQWLSAMLNGRTTPTTDQLVAICQLLRCSIDDIVEYPKEPGSDTQAVAPAESIYA